MNRTEGDERSKDLAFIDASLGCLTVYLICRTYIIKRNEEVHPKSTALTNKPGDSRSLRRPRLEFDNALARSFAGKQIILHCSSTRRQVK